MLVICGARIFARRRTCSSEPTSTYSSPSSHGFHNPAYQSKPEYQEVGDNITGRNNANNYELCSSIKNIEAGDKDFDIPNDKPSTWRDNRCFSNNQISMNLNQVDLFTQKKLHKSNRQTLLYSI